MSQKPSENHARMTRRQVIQMAGLTPLLTGGLLVACGPSPVIPSSSPSALAPGGTLDQYAKQLAERDEFSGTLLVAKGGKPVLLQAYGMANKELQISNAPQTLYATASIAKSFTATAITQLAQQQKLAFTDPLGKYLSGFPSSIAQEVTIHQLLTHTSGMGDFRQTPAFKTEQVNWKSSAETMNGILNIIRQQPLRFSPGADFFYSNSGYIILGAIVAAVSGMDYYDYIHQYIFSAAGMIQSRFYTKQEREHHKDIAHPYSSGPDFMHPTPGPRTDVSESLSFIGSPAGDAYTTAEDMLRYCQALRTHQLLNPSFTDLLMAGKIPVKGPSDQRSNKYAYGLTDTLFKGKRLVWHNGGSLGAATMFEMFPEVDWCLVILSNYSPGEPFGALLKKAEELIMQS